MNITVGPDEKYAVLPSTRLDAEPVLVNCAGPMDNFQCSGRGDAQAILSTAHVAAGTMRREENAGNEKK